MPVRVQDRCRQEAAFVGLINLALICMRYTAGEGCPEEAVPAGAAPVHPHTGSRWEATQVGTAPAHRSIDTQPGRFVDCPAALSTAQSSAALHPGCVRIEAQRRHPDFVYARAQYGC